MGSRYHMIQLREARRPESSYDDLRRKLNGPGGFPNFSPGHEKMVTKALGALALEVHREANRGQRINLEGRNIMVDLRDFGLHVGLHERIAGGIDTNENWIRASRPLEVQ